jgi:peptidylprolyl isomerase
MYRPATMRSLLVLAVAVFMAGPSVSSATQTPPPAPATKQPAKPAAAAPQTAKPGTAKPGPAKPGTAKPATKKPGPPAAAKAALPSREAITTPSGLTYVITSRANGRRPKPGETVLVHYTGTLTDGTKFDSSQDRKEPIAFPLGRGAVIKGWDEGIAHLGVGDRAVLVIPPQLGYGASGAGGVIPPDATLVFVVTLVDIKGEALSQVLSRTLDDKGLEAAIAEYRGLKERGFGELYANEGELNTLGYRLLRQKKVQEAIEFLKLNVEAYPQSANVYDSLAEAYLFNGDRELAVQNYEKSLSLDPSNTNAAMMLKKLKGQ